MCFALVEIDQGIFLKLLRFRYLSSTGGNNKNAS